MYTLSSPLHYLIPSGQPSEQPSRQPTVRPSIPTSQPSRQPSTQVLLLLLLLLLLILPYSKCCCTIAVVTFSLHHFLRFSPLVLWPQLFTAQTAPSYHTLYPQILIYTHTTSLPYFLSYSTLYNTTSHHICQRNNQVQNHQGKEYLLDNRPISPQVEIPTRPLSLT